MSFHLLESTNFKEPSFISFPLGRYFTVLKTAVQAVKISTCSTWTFQFQEVLCAKFASLVSVTLGRVCMCSMPFSRGVWKITENKLNNYDTGSNGKKNILHGS